MNEPKFKLSNINQFRFWCNKVLPAVYDDSLSYYELLCKVIDKLNEIIEVDNKQNKAIMCIINELERLKKMHYNFFDSYYDSYKFSNYVLRIPFKFIDAYANMNRPQGFCLLNNNVGLIALTNSRTTNDTVLVEVNLDTGLKIQDFPTSFGHANSLCFNPINNRIYVCPAYDYVNDTNVNYFHILNPFDMSIEDTIILDAIPHSFCFDKATKKMYLVTEEQNPFKLKLWCFNPVTNEKTFMCEVPYNVEDYAATDMTNVGTQSIGCYAGNFFYLVGGASYNVLINFDPCGKIKNIVNIDSACFVYNIREAQDFDFTEYGDVVLCSEANTTVSTGYALISNFNLLGNKIVDFAITNEKYAVFTNGYVDDTNLTTNFRCYGSDAKPFTTLDEVFPLIVDNRKYNINIQNSSTYAMTNNMFRFSNNIFIVAPDDENPTIVLPQDSWEEGYKITFKNCIITCDTEDVAYLMRCSNTGELCFYHCTFDCENLNASNEIIRNYGICKIYTCDLANGESATVNGRSSGVSFYNGQNTGITFTYPGNISGVIE